MPRSAPSTLPQVALVLLLAACGGGGGDAGTAFPPPPPAAVCTASAPIPSPGASAPQVTLALTNGAGVNGDVVLTLDAGRAPVTVANFLAYVNAGFFDGTVFHRRSPSFVLQGGGYAGPLTAGGAMPSEKDTRPAITLEDNVGLSNLCLTVAMARLTAPDSATSQFFVNLANNPALDRTLTARGYAVFGSVTGGSEVITAANSATCTPWPTFLPAGDCLPTPNITITRARQTR
ncbi:MAG: peptidylprolyl isomerase [Rubrivivax sp.]|nr:peptidylprolyl isomerase [Rubrivivax sp.]